MADRIFPSARLTTISTSKVFLPTSATYFPASVLLTSTQLFGLSVAGLTSGGERHHGHVTYRAGSYSTRL